MKRNIILMFLKFGKPVAELLGIHTYVKLVWKKSRPIRLRWILWTPPYSKTHKIAGVSVKFKLNKELKANRFEEIKEDQFIQDLLANIDPDDVYYDIGAHIGVHTVFPGEVIKKGNGSVVSVEAQPKSSKILKEVIDDVGLSSVVSVINIALSDKKGETQFIKRSTSSAAMDALGHADKIENNTEEPITVEMDRGDNIIQAKNLPAPTVMKIDVEGAELKVIHGLEENIKKSCRVLYIETHPEKIEHYGGSIDELRSTIANLGFNIEIRNYDGKQFIKGIRIA